MLLGLLLLVIHLSKLEYGHGYLSLCCSCPLVWVTVSWWPLVWVACAQSWADMAPQFSVFLWYCCFCFSPGRRCIRTRFGCQGRHCSGKQREREETEDTNIDVRKDSLMLWPAHCCNCFASFQVWYSDAASQCQSSLQLC